MTRAGILGLLLAAGCSSSGGGGDAGGTLTAEQACTDNARATCQKNQECSPSAFITSFGDEPTCEARIKALCLAINTAPSSGANAEKAEACARAYPTYPCADYRDRTNIPAACQPVMGGLAAGSACEFPAQCESAFCAVAPGSRCGTCAASPGPGASCANLVNCSADLMCTSDTLQCATIAGPGEPCGTGLPCGAGLSCVSDAGSGTPGTCQTAGATVGAPCDGSLKTRSACDNALGLYCDGVTRTCAMARYADAGACGYDVEAGTNVLCVAGSCQGSAPGKGIAGQCVSRTLDQGACSVPEGGASVSSAGCLPPARCIAFTGKCELVTGSSCP